MNNKAFGEHISKLRKEKNLTQKDLAEKVYVGDKAISKWETGKSFPDLSTISLLAKALDVSVVELLQIQDADNIVENTDNIQTMINQANKKATSKYKVLMLVSFVVCIVIGSIMSKSNGELPNAYSAIGDNATLVNFRVNSNPKVLYSPISNATVSCGWGCFVGHTGTDFTNQDLAEGKSTNVYAISDGWISEIGHSDSKGHWLVIENEEFSYLYAFLDNLDGIEIYSDIKAGDLLLQKNPLPSGWSTGPCVEVILYQNDEAIKPQDVVLLDY